MHGAVSRPICSSRSIQAWAFALLSIAAGRCAALDCPAVVRIVLPTIAAPPFFNGTGEALADDPGWSVVWSRAAIAKTGCQPKVEFTRLPISRMVLNLGTNSADIALTASPSNVVARVLRFPETNGTIATNLSIGEARIKFYVKSGTAFRWDPANPGLPPSTIIGVTRGTASQSVGESKGWTLDDSPDMQINFQKLMLGRVTAVLENSIVADEEIKAFPAGSIQELDDPVQIVQYYSPASRVFYASYPEFVERYWLNVCKESRSVFKQLPRCAL